MRLRVGGGGQNPPVDVSVPSERQGAGGGSATVAPSPSWLLTLPTCMLWPQGAGQDLEADRM